MTARPLALAADNEYLVSRQGNLDLLRLPGSNVSQRHARSPPAIARISPSHNNSGYMPEVFGSEEAASLGAIVVDAAVQKFE